MDISDTEMLAMLGATLTPKHKGLFFCCRLMDFLQPRKKGEKKTYNTRDSLVVTDPTTSLALIGLSMGERTGSRVFQWVWSYVVDDSIKLVYTLFFLPNPEPHPAPSGPGKSTISLGRLAVALSTRPQRKGACFRGWQQTAVV